MGFFSKIKAAATGVCSVCGKETVHVGSDAFVCDDCLKTMRTKGFVYYTDMVKGKKPTPETICEYAKHRDAILEKYRKPQLTGASASDVTERTIRDGYSLVTTGKFAAAYGEYEGMIVDLADVYAVGYDEIFDKKLQQKGYSTFSFVLLTKDGHVPYIGQAVYIKQKGIFSKTDKEELEAQVEKFTSACPNLQYPVTVIKELKKALKSNGALTPEADRALGEATGMSGAFDYHFLTDKGSGAVDGLPASGLYDWLREYGYYDLMEIAKMVK